MLWFRFLLRVVDLKNVNSHQVVYIFAHRSAFSLQKEQTFQKYFTWEDTLLTTFLCILRQILILNISGYLWNTSNAIATASMQSFMP
jgi:hypothetical protein